MQMSSGSKFKALYITYSQSNYSLPIPLLELIKHINDEFQFHLRDVAVDNNNHIPSAMDKVELSFKGCFNVDSHT